jgi:hypothetical protein
MMISGNNFTPIFYLARIGALRFAAADWNCSIVPRFFGQVGAGTGKGEDQSGSTRSVTAMQFTIGMAASGANQVFNVPKDASRLLRISVSALPFISVCS